MSELKCPYCASDRCGKEYELTWKDERFATYYVARCKACDVGFVLPLPTPTELDDLYNSLQYQSGDRATIDFSSASEQEIESRIKQEERILKKYQPHIPDSGHVLDIGAGWGTLLKFFSNQGFQTTGLELSEPTSRFAKEQLGLEIYNLPVERIEELPDQKYDLVTMRHVLEHFYTPKDVLLSLRERMTAESKMIIEVPDYGSYDRRAFGKEWPAFGPYHLWYFSRSSLERLLDDCGFEVLHFHTFLSEKIMKGNSLFQRSARSLLNRVNAKRLFSGRSIGLIAQKRADFTSQQES